MSARDKAYQRHSDAAASALPVIDLSGDPMAAIAQIRKLMIERTELLDALRGTLAYILDENPGRADCDAYTAKVCDDAREAIVKATGRCDV